MRKTSILVVDDEPSIVRYLRANLEDNGYQIFTALDGIEALHIVEKEMPDVVILDIMMPKMNGFEVCKRIREWASMPIIMLSARADEKDKVSCLNMGADDYITKPFGPGELIARINAVLRRSEKAASPPAAPCFAAGDLRIDFVRRRVTIGDREVKLTPTEYALLQELSLNAGKVLTHVHLLNRVWGPEYREEREYLHVFIRRLRAKIEAVPTKPKYIATVSGVGYQLKDAA